MKGYFSVTPVDSFDAVMHRLSVGLKKEGFGSPKELGVSNIQSLIPETNLSYFKLISVANPKFAFESLASESERRRLRHLNILVAQEYNGKISVSAENPLERISAGTNENLKIVAELIRLKLQCVLENL